MKQLDILGKLFGSAARVKVLKFFLLNQDAGFAADDIAARLRLKVPTLRPELNDLVKAGFIRQKTLTLTIEGKRSVRKKKVVGFIANRDFALREPLRALLVESGGMHTADLPARFGGAGKIGLFVVSGIFLHDPERLMDLMIVGDRLDRRAVDAEIKKIEAEIGKELRYAVFDTAEFTYRLKMYDRLLRDVFDYPHHKLVNKIENARLANGFA